MNAVLMKLNSRINKHISNLFLAETIYMLSGVMLAATGSIYLFYSNELIYEVAAFSFFVITLFSGVLCYNISHYSNASTNKVSDDKSKADK